MPNRSLEANTRWAEELREIIIRSDDARAVLDQLAAAIDEQLGGSDVIPHRLPQPMAQLCDALRRELDQISSRANAAFRRYSSDPVAHLFKQMKLSNEEYHLLRAMGATAAELSHQEPDEEGKDGLRRLPNTR